MTTKNKRLAAQQAQQRPAAHGMITPPEIVAGLQIRRTLGEDLVFGRCNHAMQLLPNGTVILLVTHEEDGANVVETFFMNEEISSFKAIKSMIEAPDDTDQPE